MLERPCEQDDAEVEIFIDGAYFEKAKGGWGLRSVDVMQFCDWCLTCCSSGLQHRLTRYYDCLPYVDETLSPNDPVRRWQEQRWEGRDKYFKLLSENKRFEVRVGRVAPRGSSTKIATYLWEQDDGQMRYIPRDANGQKIFFVQKQVDMMIGIDIVKTLWKTPSVKHIVLVAGDADFLPAVQFARDEGRTVALVHATGGAKAAVHDSLLAAADDLFPFDKALLEGMPWRGRWGSKAKR